MMRLLVIGSVAALLGGSAALLGAQDSPAPRKETVRAFSLRVTGDGHVEMTVQENGQQKTYQADSMEEFTKKYPDLVREYGIGRGGLKSWSFREPGDLAKRMEELRKQFGQFDFGSDDPEFRKLLEHPEQFLQGHAPKGEDQAPAGPRLGVRLAPLSSALADQLGLDVNAGVLITDVEAGSTAEKSGLRANDILVRVDGKDVAGAEGVRATVREALKKKEFEVDVLRHGKKQTLKVHSPESK